jgi:hypothetical protein
MIDFAPYRAQITAIDLGLLTLIVVVILVQLALTVISDMSGKRVPQLWVPPLVVTMLGILVRMDTMIHRLGGFLKSQGDPWEIAKAAHAPTRYLMPIGDILCMMPVVALLIYAEVRAWQYFNGNSKAQILYLAGTLLFVGLGVAGWILAATKAKTGF